MRKYLLLTLLLSTTTIAPLAQSPDEITGRVVSSSGDPLNKITIFLKRSSVTTDENGFFNLPAATPLIRFREPGFRPLSILIHPSSAPLNIVLEDAKATTWNIPACSNSNEAGRRIGDDFPFLLPKGKNVESVRDIDYVEKFISNPNGAGRLSIMMGPLVGGMASVSYEDEISASSRYAERWVSTPNQSHIGIDAVGTLKSGNSWRGCGLSVVALARYWDVPIDAAKYFDTIIDSVCVSQTWLQGVSKSQ